MMSSSELERNAATLSGTSGDYLQKELEQWRKTRTEKAGVEVPAKPVSLAGSLTSASGDKLIMTLFFALFIFLFIYDAAQNKLGSSNGKFISFVDTCSNVYQYKNELVTRGPSSQSGIGMLHACRIFLASFFIKFFSQTMVSLLLNQTPVVLKGARHVCSFFIGLALLWCFPGDFIYQNMRKSRAIRVLVQMGGGLYKMRKAMFAVEVAAFTGNTRFGGFGMALLVAVLSIDGSSLTRRGMLQLGVGSACCPEFWSGFKFTQATLWRDGLRALRILFVGTILPIGLVTSTMWIVSRIDWSDGITDDDFLWLRVALLAVFLWRAGIFQEMYSIHDETFALARQISDEHRQAELRAASLATGAYAKKGQ